MIAQKPLRLSHVDLPLELCHELFPPDVPGVGARAHILQAEAGLFTRQLRVDREIRAYKISILLALQSHVLEAQLKAGNFVCFAVGHQPVVSVAAVVSVSHNAREVVDRGRVLHGFAGADEFGDRIGIVSGEMRDCRFRDHDSGRVDPKIVAAVYESGEAVHQHSVAFGRNNV